MQNNQFEFMSNSLKNFMQNRDKALASHRKNIESLGEANRMAVDVMKNISELQQQYIKQTFETISGMMKEIFSQPQNQESWQKHVEAAKEHINRSFDHSSTVANVLNKSHKEIYESMKNTLSDHVEAAKKASNKSKH